VLAGNRGEQAGQVIGRIPVVVVQVSDVAAVRGVAQDRLQRTPEPAGVETAVALRGRVAEVDHRDGDVRRPLVEERLEHAAVTLPTVDADQHLDPAREALGIDRAKRLRDRGPDDGRHHDADLEGGLQIVYHGIGSVAPDRKTGSETVFLTRAGTPAPANVPGPTVASGET